MAYDVYKDDIKKAENRVRIVEEMIIAAQQYGMYNLASHLQEELQMVKKELDNLKALRELDFNICNGIIINSVNLTRSVS